ncbi:unnamed protein product [Schistosoma margrebowiei]|uniref:Uncharacterized protein n=1 Tax=Schistosoma margrebowiei TaxID=48269 RepID=A0A183MHN8_9TREM|nr:unnamed protein product [Schistosoma margrebowiei]
MVVGGSRQETLDPGFVLLGTRQQGVPIFRKKRWKWIGHTLRKAPNYVTKQAITWNPQSQMKRDRQKNTLLRKMETDMRRMNNNWIELKRKAQVELVGEC